VNTGGDPKSLLFVTAKKHNSWTLVQPHRPCDDYTIIITLLTGSQELLLHDLFVYGVINPMDNFIMGNKQPGSRPSLVKYVNSSVRQCVNKPSWNGNIKLKNKVHTRTHNCTGFRQDGAPVTPSQISVKNNEMKSLC